jgi:cytochrome c oxidase subunit 3
MSENDDKFFYNAEKKFNLHPFHLVDPSPWPFFTSIALFVFTLGTVLFFHTFKYGVYILFFGLFFLISTMAIWWRDVIREATFRGQHTLKVTEGLRLGVVLFIISEVMFFVSFFWAFFHSSLAPSIEIGGVWPPKGLEVLNPFGLPLLNTLILLSSGATVTYAHYCIQNQDLKNGCIAFLATIFLAIVFTLFQAYEYVEAPFNLSDGIYASTFFVATGFHGLHVIIGTVFLMTCFYRFMSLHFTSRHHLGFEAAAWYWHFVDVVWLILFIFVYVWGSK